MKALARTCLLLLTGAATAAGGYGFWTQSASFPLDHPSLYSLSLAPLLIGVLGLIASFSPFDNPKAALRWASTLVGLSLGIALGGLVIFTPSFLWLAGPLLVYAFLTHTCARVVAGVRSGPPVSAEPGSDSKVDTDFGVSDSKSTTIQPPQPEDDEGEDPSDPYGHGTTYMVQQALDDADETAGQTRGVRALQLTFAALGVALCFAWKPTPGGARPAALDAEWVPVLSAPAARRMTRRIVRETDRIELSGMRVQVTASLRRPRLIVEQHRQQVIVEPCLLIEQGSVDGFFAIPALNGYSLEPGWNTDEAGLAKVEFIEGKNRGWVRIEYDHGRIRYPEGLAAVAPGLGRRAGAADISAVVELEVDFASGRVTIDARTRLTRSAAVHASTLCFLSLKGASDGLLRLGLGHETALWSMTRREGGRWLGGGLSFLAHDGKLARLLRAKRQDEGPYEMRQVGAFDGWLTLPGEHEPLLVVAPDWDRQASHGSSRGAGHGLPENALVAYREGEDVHLLLDLAGTRLGPSRVTTELPAGVYRNRLVLLPLGKASAEVVAKRQLERLALEPPVSPASGSSRGTPTAGSGSHKPG